MLSRPATHAVALAVAFLAAAPADAARSAFDCANAQPFSVDTTICNIPQLTALDAEMARLDRLGRSSPAPGWARQRDACGRVGATEQEAACLRDLYMVRIAELRAGSKAARSKDEAGISRGPLPFICEGRRGYVIATFANSEPGLVLLQLGREHWVLEQVRSASGAKYVGEGGEAAQLFWTQGREAQLRTESGSAETRCSQEGATG